MNSVAQPSLEDQPWWRHGMVWLVVGGPLAVVVAGLFTVYIAVQGADAVVSPSHPTSGVTRPEQDQSPQQVPAMQARNHAATPDRDLPQSRPIQP